MLANGTRRCLDGDACNLPTAAGEVHRRLPIACSRMLLTAKDPQLTTSFKQAHLLQLAWLTLAAVRLIAAADLCCMPIFARESPAVQAPAGGELWPARQAVKPAGRPARPFMEDGMYQRVQELALCDPFSGKDRYAVHAGGSNM